MSTRYPATNPLDRIFLGIASLVIVFADALVLHYWVVTSIDPPPYEATAVAARAEASAATRVANASTPACADCP